MGLRERKKKNTRESILAAARVLFFSDGYKATSMEMIAESSDVAVGTIYNYFQSKADVMVEVNVQDTDRALSRIIQLDIKSSPVEDLIWEVVEIIMEFLAVYPRELIREIFSATLANQGSSLTSGLKSEDERFLNFISGVIGNLRDTGRLKVETEPDTVAFAIYSLMFGGIIWYTFDDRSSIEETKAMIAAMIGQFCRGILPDGS